MTPDLHVRSWTPADRSWVLGSWKAAMSGFDRSECAGQQCLLCAAWPIKDATHRCPKANRRGSTLPWPLRFSRTEFWALANHIVDSITVPSCRILIAALPEDEACTTSWIAVRGTRTVYAYTKPKFRQMGIHRMLRTEANADKFAGFDPIMELER